jgi:hypothetical protein
VASGKRGQVPGPRRGADRVGLLEGQQALGLSLGRQGGGIGGGQVAQAMLTFSGNDTRTRLTSIFLSPDLLP